MTIMNVGVHENISSRSLLTLNKTLSIEESQGLVMPDPKITVNGEPFREIRLPPGISHIRTEDMIKSSEELKILCWVMTAPENHKSKARKVKETWGKRCNILLFMSSSVDLELPSVKLNLVQDDRQRLWQKSKEAFRYIYKYYRDKADWFLKADDDTFVIVENLRYMLQNFQPADPIYFGSPLKEEDLKRIKHSKNEKFVSGGAGYVLSRNALTRLVDIALKGKSKHGQCHYTKNMGPEDIEIGRCLESVDVHIGVSKDKIGRTRFHREPPTHTSYFNS